LAGAAAAAWGGVAISFQVIGPDAGPWPAILGAIGFQAGQPGPPRIIVVRGAAEGQGVDWAARAAGGALVILDGDSAAARSLGFRASSRRVRTVAVEDLRNPGLDIVWEHPVEVLLSETPPQATVFARERHSGVPLMAGFRTGQGGVLWLAVPPGERGYERFPYLLHALADIGAAPPFRSRRLWAFFDSSYRLRVDADYMAGRWLRAGICGLHVAAWRYFEPDRERDAYLQRLIEACHRRGILVYAWLEPPHVSERFWDAHPDWREKTALGDDAHLDWRKLMNLQNPACFRAAAEGVELLLRRFEWDGVNLAELYFESLQGHENPSRFTPMNENVRRAFRSLAGFDPLELFDKTSAHYNARNPAGLRRFLDYRAELALSMQEQWLRVAEEARRFQPDLDVVLTHVDDRLDLRMRDAIGADAASAAPLVSRFAFTFMVEDPATVWHLGPERYARLAGRYERLVRDPRRLAIDINITPRYQDVYPTRQQTGTELFLLVHGAARAFRRVALYPEHSIEAADEVWLAAAAAAVERAAYDGRRLTVRSRDGVGVCWPGPAMVNGRLWPASDGETLWLPAGEHVVEPAGRAPDVRLLHLAGELLDAEPLAGGLSFRYRSSGPAYAVTDKRPRGVELDGTEAPAAPLEAEGRYTVRLPKGEHTVRLWGAGGP